MHPKDVFEANLSMIERVIERVCRVARLPAADAEDFASCARLHLIENDYDVIRRHDRSASLATYLTVVLQRHLIDLRNRERGRWRPSSEAQRMGEAGVLLERLLGRDRRPLAEVVPIVVAADPSLTERDVASMAARLPDRPRRPRAVELDDDVALTAAATDDAASRVDEAERRRLGETTSRALRDALNALSVEDRMIVRMRFGASMAVSDISRVLRRPQRPLYRRLDALLAQLRNALARAGVGVAEAEELIGAKETALDAGLGRQTADAGQSIEMTGGPAGGQT